MKTYRILDLYCGGGGAAKGYHDAGFEVTGVDSKFQPDYPADVVRDQRSIEIPKDPRGYAGKYASFRQNIKELRLQ